MNPDSVANSELAAELTRLRRQNAELRQLLVVCESELTELRSRELALQGIEQLQQHLLGIIESSSDFIAIATPQGQGLYINSAGRKMVGVDDLEHVRRTQIIDYFAAADLPLVQEHVLPALLHDGRWEGDLRFRHLKTGEPIPVFYSAFAVKDLVDGKVLGFGTVTRNLTGERQMQADLAREQLKNETIRIQAELLAELSTPLIPLSDEVVIMPLIGAMEASRAERVLATLLEGVSSRQARVAIIDVTGVGTIDTKTASTLLQAAQAVRLLGAEVVLTGIRAEVAQTLIQLGIDLQAVTTRSTVQGGIIYAMRRRAR